MQDHNIDSTSAIRATTQLRNRSIAGVIRSTWTRARRTVSHIASHAIIVRVGRHDHS